MNPFWKYLTKSQVNLLQEALQENSQGQAPLGIQGCVCAGEGEGWCQEPSEPEQHRSRSVEQILSSQQALRQHGMGCSVRSLRLL